MHEVNRKAGLADLTEFRTLHQHGPTDWRLAYDGLNCDATVIGILKGRGFGARALARARLARSSLTARRSTLNLVANMPTRGPCYDGVEVEVSMYKATGEGPRCASSANHRRAYLTVDQSVHAQGRSRNGAVTHVRRTWNARCSRSIAWCSSALQSGSFNRPGYLARLQMDWRTFALRARRDVEDVSNRAVRE